MQAVRRHTLGILARMFPEHAPNPAQLVPPVFSPLAVPYQFNPALGFIGGLVAVAATFARILTVCMVFAIWGTLSLLAWSRIGSQFWRMVALLPLMLALPAALIPPMLAIGAVEKWMRPRRR
jgi:hypothetical protein